MSTYQDISLSLSLSLFLSPSLRPSLPPSLFLVSLSLPLFLSSSLPLSLTLYGRSYMFLSVSVFAQLWICFCTDFCTEAQVQDMTHAFKSMADPFIAGKAPLVKVSYYMCYMYNTYACSWARTYQGHIRDVLGHIRDILGTYQDILGMCIIRMPKAGKAPLVHNTYTADMHAIHNAHNTSDYSISLSLSLSLSLHIGARRFNGTLYQDTGGTHSQKYSPQ